LLFGTGIEAFDTDIDYKVLAKNPAERYPSILDLANSFAEAVDGCD
jgi:hypothetical protein